MHYRILRYLTRPHLFVVARERRESGLPDRHTYPDFHKLPKRGRYVITYAYPFLDGCGTGIPHMKCFIMFPEGGIAWYMDILVPTYKKLPRLWTSNPHAYRL